MAPPGDAKPGRVRDAVGDQGVEAGQDVGPLVLAPGAGHHGGEGVAMSCATARVGWNTAKPAAARH